MSWLPTAVVVLLLLRLAAQLVLDALNRAEIALHAGVPPGTLEAIMDEATFARAADYALARSRFASWNSLFEAAVLLAVLWSGALPWAWARVDAVAPGAAWSGALFLTAGFTVLGLVHLPLDWWAQFRLEARFGFNRSTPGLWAADQGKGLALGVLLGWPLAWALLGLIRWTGPSWWIWGFALLFGFQLLLLVLYPKLILPWFNRLTPLPAGEQRERLLALAERTGFPAQTIEVIDGSKRSTHANAFFTGFGRFRRIVLFDTLLTRLAPEELEAVLAHEIGHYRRGHIPQRLVSAAVLQAGAFAALAWLLQAPWFNPAFGLPAGAAAPSLLLFALLGGLVTFWFSPVGHWISRRHEYQADAFAKQALGSAAPMVAALHKLARENLANLTPHPLYSAVHYSHPTVVERERALVR